MKVTIAILVGLLAVSTAWSYNRATKTLGEKSSTQLPTEKRPTAMLGSSATDAMFRDFINTFNLQKEKAWSSLIAARKSHPSVDFIMEGSLDYYLQNTSLYTSRGVPANLIRSVVEDRLTRIAFSEGNIRKMASQIKQQIIEAQPNQARLIGTLFTFSTLRGRAGAFFTAMDQKSGDYDIFFIDFPLRITVGDNIAASSFTTKFFFNLLNKREVTYLIKPSKVDLNSIEQIFEFFQFAAIQKFQETFK